MTTPAIIRLHNIWSAIDVSITHDGNPSDILNLLSRFYQLDKEQQTEEQLRSLYLSNYDTEVLQANRGTLKMGVEQSSLPSWEYTVNIDSNLVVACHELWNKSEEAAIICDPYDYMLCIKDESKSKIKQSIDSALDNLKQIGITLLVP